MKTLFPLLIVILLSACNSALVNTAVTAAHTGTNIYCGSLSNAQRQEFRQSYNQDSQHELSIQCAADMPSKGSE